MKLINDSSLPFLDTVQMAEVDRAMIEDYRIDLIQMMENAGRNLAHLARNRFFAGDPVGKRVAVMAGSGGNGGGALVAARHLHNCGSSVHVYLGRSLDAMPPIPRHQLDIIQRMNIPSATAIPEEAKPGAPFDLILDGLIGYSLSGAPHGTIGELIRWANRQATPILSLDIPSGIDATTGTAHDPTIKATATMTLALPKKGLRAPSAKDFIGELYLADIGVPPELYTHLSLGLNVGPLFAHSEIVQLW